MEWFKEQRRKKITVKRYRLKHIARRLARTNEIEVYDFQFSQGWSTGFLRRNGLTNRQVTHKAQQNQTTTEANKQIVSDFLKGCNKISTSYELNCIYSAGTEHFFHVNSLKFT